MERIIELSKSKVLAVNTEFKRYLMNEIPQNQRLIFIKGARGSGKTTLLLQYLRLLNKEADKSVYISLDDILFTNLQVVDFADWFYKRGGELLVIDEVHKYPDWSRSIKTIYDRYSDLKMIITCSSALQLGQGDADLSRRSLIFHLNELSLREFINIKYRIDLPSYSLNDLIANHEAYEPLIVSKIKPLMVFEQYLKYGAYPFFNEGEAFYLQRLSSIVNLILETDLPAIESITFGTVLKIKRLLAIIAEVVPFTPNISNLSQKVGVTRDQLYRFLYILEKAEILYLLRKDAKGMSMLAKPERIFLHNPNLSEALTHTRTNIGTLRETFFINQLSGLYQVTHTSQGDFLVNGKFIFEIGGVNKTKNQIRNIKNSFIAKDGIEHGIGNTIPLWLFGFLY